MNVNKQTESLAPYPMEELAILRQELIAKGVKVYDFGTGDPRIPVWKPIRDQLASAITEVSQYPSVKGSQELLDAQASYLQRRFGLEVGSGLMTIPTMGSKEAVFHIALSLVGRSGKKTIVYPDPGYPVYYSSAVFAQGRPYPVGLHAENGYKLEPWNLPDEVQSDTTAVWVNYPHNPTGAVVDRSYWEKLVEWAHRKDVIILSDDCYVDIYDTKLDSVSERERLPMTPLQVSCDRVLAFFSLSKRSGMTGYRSGMIAGDPKIISPHLRARANFGLGVPQFIQAAASVAWRDDQHVVERRQTFTRRLNLAFETLGDLGMLATVPEATFYLWCQLPKAYKGDDVSFAKELAQQGVICTPSQWLGDSVKGCVRFAMVPDESDTAEAMSILSKFVKQIS